MLIRKFHVSAFTGPNHSVHVERDYETTSHHAAAKKFAEEHNETPFPGRWEQPKDGRAVMSFGWTGHGQRIWVTEL